MVFAGGNGTEQDPYQIITLAQLDEIRNDLTAHYILMNDIDASDTVNWTNDKGTGFKKIGTWGNPSNITIDGNGYRITNLYINSNEDDVGFIGNCTTTTIRDLGLENITVIGKLSVAGLVGISEDGGIAIENSYVTGSITGTGQVAGLVGFSSGNSTNNISNCYVNATLTSDSDVAGLIGHMGSEVITNCYVAASMTGTEKYALGDIIWSPLTVNDSFWDTDISGVTSNLTSTGLRFGTGLTTAQMKEQATYINWDFEDTWIMINDDYPNLRMFTESQNPPSSPIITITNITATRISDKIGKDVCTVTFTADQDLIEWEARAEGNGAGQGLLVGSGGAVTIGTEISFDIENEELTLGDKTYRINIYGKNEQGVWTEYE